MCLFACQLVLAADDDANAEGDQAPKRSYSGRITMHATPFDDKIKDKEQDDDIDVPDQGFSRRSMTDYDNSLQHTISPRLSSMPVQVPPPARSRNEKDKKKDNWLTIITDQNVDEEKSDFAPAGWGWLADEAFSMQSIDQQRIEDRSEEMEKDDESTVYQGGESDDKKKEDPSLLGVNSLWKSHDPLERDVWRNLDSQPLDTPGYNEWHDVRDEDDSDEKRTAKGSRDKDDAGQWTEKSGRDYGYENDTAIQLNDVDAYGGQAMWQRGEKKYTATRNLSERSDNKRMERNTRMAGQRQEPSFSTERSFDYAAYPQQERDYSSYNAPANSSHYNQQATRFSQSSSFSGGQAPSYNSTFKPVSDFVTHRSSALENSAQRSFTGDGSVRPYAPSSPVKPINSFSQSAYENGSAASDYQPISSQQRISSRFQ